MHQNKKRKNVFLPHGGARQLWRGLESGSSGEGRGSPEGRGDTELLHCSQPAELAGGHGEHVGARRPAWLAELGIIVPFAFDG